MICAWFLKGGSTKHIRHRGQDSVDSTFSMKTLVNCAHIFGQLFWFSSRMMWQEGFCSNCKTWESGWAIIEQITRSLWRYFCFCGPFQKRGTECGDEPWCCLYCARQYQQRDQGDYLSTTPSPLSLRSAQLRVL